MEISGKSYHIQLELSNFLPRFFGKIAGVGIRLIDFIRKIPFRLIRLFRHLGTGFEGIIEWMSSITRPQPLDRKKLFKWTLEVIIRFLECLGFAELYETIFDFAKFNTRPMSEWEIELAKSVYGDSINYNRVRIDELAFVGPKQKKFCYVSFYTINSWGSMQNSLFIHELIHIWQYERLGAVYILRALQAQFSRVGYNYGGVGMLRSYLRKGKKLTDFNLEQQGEIISDYYRIKEGYSPRWGSGERKDLEVYEKFVDQLES